MGFIRAIPATAKKIMNTKIRIRLCVVSVFIEEHPFPMAREIIDPVPTHCPSDKLINIKMIGREKLMAAKGSFPR